MMPTESAQSRLLDCTCMAIYTQPVLTVCLLQLASIDVLNIALSPLSQSIQMKNPKPYFQAVTAVLAKSVVTFFIELATSAKTCLPMIDMLVYQQAPLWSSLSRDKCDVNFLFVQWLWRWLQLHLRSRSGLVYLISLLQWNVGILQLLILDFTVS